MSKACFFQGAPYKSDIIGSAASSSCLSNDNCHFVKIVFSGKKCFHNLSNNDERRVAGIVIYIFQAYINCLFVVVRENLKPISGSSKGSFEHFKMNRRHLRTKNSMCRLHFLCKRNFFDCCRADSALCLFLFSDADSSQQRAYTDTSRP